AHRPAGGDREYPEAARVDDWRVVEGHPVSLRRTECPGGDESLGVGPVDAGAPDAGERSTSHGRIGAPRVGTVGDVLVRPGAWSPRPDGLQQPAGARLRELEETRVPFPDRMDRGPRTESPRARSPLRGNGVCGPGPRTLRRIARSNGTSSTRTWPSSPRTLPSRSRSIRRSSVKVGAPASRR